MYHQFLATRNNRFCDYFNATSSECDDWRHKHLLIIWFRCLFWYFWQATSPMWFARYSPIGIIFVATIVSHRHLSNEVSLFICRSSCEITTSFSSQQSNYGCHVRLFVRIESNGTMPSAKFYLIDNSAPPKWTCAFAPSTKSTTNTETQKRYWYHVVRHWRARWTNRIHSCLGLLGAQLYTQITYFVVHALNLWSIGGDVTINLCFEWKPFAGRRPFDE